MRARSPLTLLCLAGLAGAGTLCAGRTAHAERFDPTTGAVAPAGALDTAQWPAFSAGIDNLVIAGAGNLNAVLTNIRAELIGKVQASTVTSDDAKSLSLVTAALDQRQPPPGTAMPPFGAATLEDLPESDWWRLFVDVGSWRLNLPSAPIDRRGLVFDLDLSPGYYAGMRAAFDTWLLQPSRALHQTAAAVPPMTWQQYVAMHQVVSDGVFRRQRGGYVLVPQAWSGPGVTFSVASLPQESVDPAALLELFNEHVASWTDAYLAATYPGAFPLAPVAPAWLTTQLALNAIARPVAPAPGEYQVVLYYQLVGKDSLIRAMTEWNTNNNDEQTFVQNAFQHYYTVALPAAATARAVREAICDLVRMLHVGHLFPDGNGRLNTMLLLDRLLIAANQSPSIVEDTSVFGGRATVATLADLVEQGQLRFQQVVQHR